MDAQGSLAIGIALWLALAAFAIALAAYRRVSTKTYLSQLPFFFAMAAFHACAATSPSWPDISLIAALGTAAFARLAFYWASRRSCELETPKAWAPLSYGTAVLGIAAAVAAAALPRERLPDVETAALVLFAAHALASVAVFAGTARKAKPAVWTLAAAIALALQCVFAALARFAYLPFLEDAAPYYPWANLAAETAFGGFVLLAAMYELKRPAPEETALDDYVAKVSASVKRFIPTEFLEQLEKTDFSDLKLGDHVKKEMTIYFSDIRSFTELSERLTPEESFAFINSYLSRVVPVINDQGGFVDKYMGDGIMALFAAENGADGAVESAVEIQRKMQEYNGHRAKMGYRPISMGIGIHTGTLMLGVVGVSDRMEGTVISDAVNLSSRLQSIAKAFNIPLVISERTFMNLSEPGQYKYRFIGKVRVKGKDAPVSVFEIFDGLPEELFERKMRSNTFFEQGMMSYYQKDYSNGVFYFKRALEDVPEDGASRFYLETCLRKTITAKS